MHKNAKLNGTKKKTLLRNAKLKQLYRSFYKLVCVQINVDAFTWFGITFIPNKS